MDIGRLSAQSMSLDPTIRAQLAQMRSIAERSFQAVRNIALLLRPSMLDDLGLTAAIQWQAREVSRRTGAFRRTEASRYSGAGSLADVGEAADAIPVGAAAAGSTWEAGWTTGPCCSTTDGSDSARPSSC